MLITIGYDESKRSYAEKICWTSVAKFMIKKILIFNIHLYQQ